MTLRAMSRRAGGFLMPSAPRMVGVDIHEAAEGEVVEPVVERVPVKPANFRTFWDRADPRGGHHRTDTATETHSTVRDDA